MSESFALATWPYTQVDRAAESGKWIVLLTTGSTEPHGPHMGLGVDTAISEGAALRACELLKAKGWVPSIAPPLCYGVTDCAAGFAGAISITPPVLKAMLVEIAEGWLKHGAQHVCLVNNHLEPAHYQAILEVAENRDKISVACPLERRFGRTLTDEYKSGACHAGQYETSIVMACAPLLVNEEAMQKLENVPVSLAEQLGQGVTDFHEMGLRDAYAGSPRSASAKEGRETLSKLAEMIAQVVQESLGEG